MVTSVSPESRRYCVCKWVWGLTSDERLTGVSLCIVSCVCVCNKEYTLELSLPTMFFTASSPNLKTPVVTFVDAHTISHYLQTSVLS